MAFGLSYLETHYVNNSCMYVTYLCIHIYTHIHTYIYIYIHTHKMGFPGSAAGKEPA